MAKLAGFDRLRQLVVLVAVAGCSPPEAPVASSSAVTSVDASASVALVNPDASATVPLASLSSADLVIQRFRLGPASVATIASKASQAAWAPPVWQFPNSSTKSIDVLSSGDLVARFNGTAQGPALVTLPVQAAGAFQLTDVESGFPSR
jgi:hypothetical protein